MMHFLSLPGLKHCASLANAAWAAPGVVPHRGLPPATAADTSIAPVFALTAARQRSTIDTLPVSARGITGASIATGMKTFGVVGWSGSGKTTLIEKIVPCFTERGMRVSVLKHAHHPFDVDRPGKDSYRHRQAGATEVLITSAHRWVLMHELRGAHEPSFEDQVKRLSPCDLLIVEGWKPAPVPKLEVWRAGTGTAFLHPQDPGIVAVASDVTIETTLPLLDLNDSAGIAAFILKNLGLT